MRVTTDFFVSALVRRIFSNGGFAAIAKKGAAEAGAVFVIVDRLDGSYDFYGPAPQTYFTEMREGRVFEKVLTEVERDKITEKLAREMRMDPDHWVVEIEARGGEVDLPLVKDTGEPDRPF